MANKKKSKPKPSGFSEISSDLRRRLFFFGPRLLLGTDSRNTGRNQHRFVAKTFFLVFTCFWGQIPETLAEVKTDFVQQTCNLILVKLLVARNNFSPVNVTRTSKKVGQAWITTFAKQSYTNIDTNSKLSLNPQYCKLAILKLPELHTLEIARVMHQYPVQIFLLSYSTFFAPISPCA